MGTVEELGALPELGRPSFMESTAAMQCLRIIDGIVARAEVDSPPVGIAAQDSASSPAIVRDSDSRGVTSTHELMKPGPFPSPDADLLLQPRSFSASGAVQLHPRAFFTRSNA